LNQSLIKGDFDEFVKEALAGGVDMVQLRDPGKQMPAAELLEQARRLKTITRGKALLVINDRVDVAMAMEADGVQLPEDGLPTRIARGLIGKYAVVGRSVRSVDAANQAQRDGVEFVIAGEIYESVSHPGEKPLGIKLISEITKDSSLPVIAIGGITADKVSELVLAGAAGVAVQSTITGAKDPKAAAEELNTALREAWSERTKAARASA
jgi:thiamine-phosphate pyrophosphorylase